MRIEDHVSIDTQAIEKNIRSIFFAELCRSMPTLILTPRYTEDAQALWRAAISQGWNVERLTNWRLADELVAVEEPVLYLEALMAPTIAERFGLQLLEPATDWLPNLAQKYRQRSIYLTALGEAHCLTSAAFIKPPNDKSFPAKVYQPGELSHDYADNTEVLVAEIVEWECEFRCFILDRQLQTFSIYLRRGKLQREAGFTHSPAEAVAVRDFIGIILADSQIELPQATVIDIGIVAGRGWAVVEQNSAWGAGIYGCDPAVVLEVLRHAAVPQLKG